MTNVTLKLRTSVVLVWSDQNSYKHGKELFPIRPSPGFVITIADQQQPFLTFFFFILNTALQITPGQQCQLSATTFLIECSFFNMIEVLNRYKSCITSTILVQLKWYNLLMWMQFYWYKSVFYHNSLFLFQYVNQHSYTSITAFTQGIVPAKLFQYFFLKSHPYPKQWYWYTICVQFWPQIARGNKLEEAISWFRLEEEWECKGIWFAS